VSQEREKREEKYLQPLVTKNKNIAELVIWGTGYLKQVDKDFIFQTVRR
jgi:hypothetical protein